MRTCGSERSAVELDLTETIDNDVCASGGVTKLEDAARYCETLTYGEGELVPSGDAFERRLIARIWSLSNRDAEACVNNNHKLATPHSGILYLNVVRRTIYGSISSTEFVTPGFERNLQTNASAACDLKAED